MRLFNFLANQPWAITEAYAQRMIEIYNLALERKAHGEEFDKSALEKEIGKPLDNTRTVTTRNAVATIPVEGPLFRRADMFTDISGATTIETLAKEFNAALEDPSIKAIILLIDSPGGEVNGTNEFADMVYAARDQKPIVAYVGHSAASAAYWIASAASEVVIDATAGLGSIGVVAAVRDPNKDNSKDIEFVSSQSPKKRPNPTTETGKAVIQGLVDDLAQVFIESVARNRNVNAETVVKDFGAGALLIGQKAVDAGLADRVGSYEQVLNELANDSNEQAFRGGNTMTTAKEPTLWEKFKAALSPDEQKQFAVLASEETDEVKALRAKAAQADRYQEEIAGARKKEAELFAGELITSKKVLPAAKAKIEAAFIQAAEDDAAVPLTTGSRVEKLKASFADLPPHSLTTEQVAAGLPNGAVALNPDAGSESDKIIAAARAGAADWQKSQQAKLQEVK